MQLIKSRALMATGLLALAACNQSPAAPDANAATPAASASAAAAAPADVVQRHVDSMKTGNIETIMSDYAENTVVITPSGLVKDQTPAQGPGVFVGKADAQKVFATITQAGNMEAVKAMETSIEPKGNDVAFLRWAQNKGKPNEVTGTDVFVVRDGKIAFQDIIVNAK